MMLFPVEISREDEKDGQYKIKVAVGIGKRICWIRSLHGISTKNA